MSLISTNSYYVRINFFYNFKEVSIFITKISFIHSFYCKCYSERYCY